MDSQGKEQEFGLVELLKNAHQLKEIRDPSPLIQFGMYRFLSTFVMDAYEIQQPGEEDADDLDTVIELLETKKFSIERIGRYIKEKCPYGFDLFDTKHPFLQSEPNADWDKDLKSVANLIQHIPTGTNVTHFNHIKENEHAFSPEICARALCSIPPFMTAGGQGNSPSINGNPPWYVLIKGRNLFETIVLNCYGFDSEETIDGTEPISWRSKKTVVPKQEVSRVSLLEGLTWRPRRVRLIPGAGGICSYKGKASPILVKDIVFTSGFKAVVKDIWVDPQVAYKITDKGRMPLLPQENRELWRDTGPLLLLHEKEYSHEKRKIAFEKPKIITQFDQLIQRGVLEKSRRLEIEAYSLRTDGKMKFYEWQYESLCIPTQLTKITNIKIAIQKAMEISDLTAYYLGQALKKTYPRDGKGNKKAFNNLVIAAQKRFWQRLKPIFEKQLDNLAEQQDDINLVTNFIINWNEPLYKVAKETLDEALTPFDSSAEAMFRQVQASDDFWKRFYGIFKPYGEKVNERGGEKNAGKERK